MPHTFLTPDNSGFYLDDVSIPVTCFPIEAARNNIIYIELYDPPLEVHTDRTAFTKKIELEEGNYTVVELGNMIQTTLNQAYVDDNFSVTVSYKKKTETLPILGKEA